MSLSVLLGLLSILALVLSFVKDVVKADRNDRLAWKRTIALGFVLVLVNASIEVARRVAEARRSKASEQEMLDGRRMVKFATKDAIARVDELGRLIQSLPAATAERLARDI